MQRNTLPTEPECCCWPVLKLSLYKFEALEKTMQMLHKNIFTMFLVINSTAHESFYDHLFSFHSKRKIKYQHYSATAFKFCASLYMLKWFKMFANLFYILSDGFYAIVYYSLPATLQFICVCQTLHLTIEPKCNVTDEPQVYSMYFW